MRYFDNNATTALSPAAREAWLSANDDFWGNPSAGYQHAFRAKALIEAARNRLGEVLGVSSDLLVFCSGATEACNLWIRSYFSKTKPEGAKLLVSALEHSCVVETVKSFPQEAVCWFQVDKNQSVQKQLDVLLETHPKIGGVVLMAANNVTGERYDWRGTAAWCRKQGIPFFCDATQWIGKNPCEGLAEVDFFCGSAHKFGGPKGVGFLKVSRRFWSVRGQTGGGQEHGMRAGTENVASIHAMVCALEENRVRFEDAADIIRVRKTWKKDFVQQLSLRVPGVVIHAEPDSSLWNTVCVSMPVMESAWWVEQLDRKGFSVASGAACSSIPGGASRVLLAMGVEPELASRSLRFSSGWQQCEEDWQALLEAICLVYRTLEESRWEASTSTTVSGNGAEVISLDEL